MSKSNVRGVADCPAEEVSPSCRCKLICFAMTGLGKSTYAGKIRCRWGCMDDFEIGDLDFGSWRKKRGYQRAWLSSSDDSTRKEVYQRFVNEVIRPNLSRYDLILCNEPGLAALLPPEIPIVTAVPGEAMQDEWYQNLILRTVRQMDDTDYEPEDQASFLALVASEGRSWPNSEAWRIPGAMQLKFNSYDDWNVIYEISEMMR